MSVLILPCGPSLKLQPYINRPYSSAIAKGRRKGYFPVLRVAYGKARQSTDE